MNCLWNLAVVLALILSLPAFANPSNPIPQRLKAFQDTQAALDGQFRAFTAQVEICSIPSFGPRIIAGFTGPEAASAVNALSAHVKSVERNIEAAEQKLAEQGDLRAACRSGGFEAKLAAAEAIASEVKAKLATDAADYEAGQKVALQNESIVRTVLNKRITLSAVAQASTIEGCKKALLILGDEGKGNGPMREADKALREKLNALKEGFSERMAAIRDFGRTLASQNACGGALIRKASAFPSVREGEYQVADLPVDAGAAPAQ